MIPKKAVIPAAGLGTRLLPATKEQPKEMLPIFSKSVAGTRCMKPMLQLIFEQLYDFGIRDFCFIIGRGKRMIEDHFAPDCNFEGELRRVRRGSAAREIKRFYQRVNNSSMTWINQPEPRGFGGAVMRSAAWVAEDDFMVHAGDAYIVSDNQRALKRLCSTFYG
jgi:UTP--glucose-1-phosphate uridylyltransferase